jgi:hypothetical protein
VTQYLHPEDIQWANVLLSTLHGGRATDIPGLTFEPEGGATVDWDAMLDSWLSSTEKATVHIARGLAIIERAGGFPRQEPGNQGTVGPVVLAAVQSIVVGDADIEALLNPDPGDQP